MPARHCLPARPALALATALSSAHAARQLAPTPGSARPARHCLPARPSLALATALSSARAPRPHAPTPGSVKRARYYRQARPALGLAAELWTAHALRRRAPTPDSVKRARHCRCEVHSAPASGTWPPRPGLVPSVPRHFAARPTTEYLPSAVPRPTPLFLDAERPCAPQQNARAKVRHFRGQSNRHRAVPESP